MKNKFTSKITFSNWKDVPIFNKRLASKEDVDNNLALFTTINSEGKPFEIVLPFCAYYFEEKTKRKISFIATQAEIANNEVIIGGIQIDGKTLVCTLPELEIIEDPDQSFFIFEPKTTWWKFWKKY